MSRQPVRRSGHGNCPRNWVQTVPRPPERVLIAGPSREMTMLYYAVVFLIIALIAGALGFLGIAGAAVGIAKILFFVFLVLFVISLIIGRRGRGPRL
jgi:uncharacterized membrane protein YtjA (UPF0391 family)